MTYTPREQIVPTEEEYRQRVKQAERWALEKSPAYRKEQEEIAKRTQEENQKRSIATDKARREAEAAAQKAAQDKARADAEEAEALRKAQSDEARRIEREGYAKPRRFRCERCGELMRVENPSFHTHSSGTTCIRDIERMRRSGANPEAHEQYVPPTEQTDPASEI